MAAPLDLRRKHLWEAEVKESCPEERLHSGHRGFLAKCCIKSRLKVSHNVRVLYPDHAAFE